MSRAISIALVCGLAAPAIADPSAGRAVFTGATAPHATSLELEPAALGLANQPELYFGSLTRLDRLSIDRRTRNVDTGALEPAPRIRDHELALGAVFTGLIPLENATFGGQLKAAPPERFAQGYDSLRYHTMGGQQVSYTATVGGAAKLDPTFMFGISVSAQATYLHLRFARDTALEAGDDPNRGIGSDCGGAPCGVENAAAAEGYDVNVHSDLLSASSVLTVNLGLIYQLDRDMWIALGYHTPPGFAVQNELDGDVRVTHAPRDGGSVERGAAVVYVSQPASVDLEYRARLPAKLDLHIGMRWEDLSRVKGYDVRTYGTGFRAAGIPEWIERPRGLHDTLAMWGGVEQVDNGQLLIGGARIGFETSAVPDEQTSPITIAPHSLTLDLGAQVRLGPRVTLQASYGAQYFPTVTVSDSAFDPRDRLECIRSGYDYSTDACAAVRGGYAISSAAGDYGRIQQSLRLAFRYDLD